MSRTHCLRVLAATLALVAVPVAPGRASGINETTKVYGKIPVDLSGTWLLVSQTRMAEGKFRTYPQLLRISRKGDADFTVNLLDVQLPKEMNKAVKAGNEKLTAWTPSPEDVERLAKEWSKLPPSTDKDKDVMAGDVAYAQMTYDIAAPDKFAEAFPKQDDPLKNLLTDSGFTIYVVEGYRPLPVPEGKNVGQLIQRKTVYAVRKAGEKVLEGPQLTGFLAAGLTAPLPFSFGGSFSMYRLAGPSKNGSPPPK